MALELKIGQENGIEIVDVEGIGHSSDSQVRKISYTSPQQPDKDYFALPWDAVSSDPLFCALTKGRKNAYMLGEACKTTKKQDLAAWFNVGMRSPMVAIPALHYIYDYDSIRIGLDDGDRSNGMDSRSFGVKLLDHGA